MAKKTKTLGKLKKELQVVFNAYIRMRDEGEPCISCGSFSKLQAGHFHSVGSYDGLRFNELNVHGECARCNCWDESHLITYRRNLEAKIGRSKYLLLCMQADEYKKNGYKFTRYELQELIELYKQKLKDGI
jgi:hypothetical protein